MKYALVRILCFGLGVLGYSDSYARRYASIVMDASSGNVLQSVSSQESVGPASLTKMMTLYLLFEAMERGDIELKTPFRVSKKASNQPPCKIGLIAGKTLSVRYCILSLAVRSANDVAVTVAENLGGSVEQFARMMNAKAQKLGLWRTHFCNPHGLPHRNQRTCAMDMAKLLRAIWRRFPQYQAFLGVKEFYLRDHTYRNTNKLLGRVEGMCMGKTGYTDDSGYNLATLTTRNGKSVIVVVMGGETSAWRNHRTQNLIELAFRSNHQKSYSHHYSQELASTDSPSQTGIQTVSYTPYQEEVRTSVVDDIALHQELRDQLCPKERVFKRKKCASARIRGKKKIQKSCTLKRRRPVSVERIMEDVLGHGGEKL